jgi:hypothetical protein
MYRLYMSGIVPVTYSRPTNIFSSDRSSLIAFFIIKMIHMYIKILKKKQNTVVSNKIPLHGPYIFFILPQFGSLLYHEHDDFLVIETLYEHHPLLMGMVHLGQG